MRMGEITNRNIKLMNKTKICQFLESNFGFPNWKKTPKFYNFENHQISIIDKLKKNNQSSEIVEFLKLANFDNLIFCKTIKIQKISNSMVNYQICILSVRII